MLKLRLQQRMTNLTERINHAREKKRDQEKKREKEIMDQIKKKLGYASVFNLTYSDHYNSTTGFKNMINSKHKKGLQDDGSVSHNSRKG